MVSKITKKQIIYAAVFVLLLFFLVVLSQFYKTHPVETGQIENIDGIPFPKPDHTVITEKLAHADVYVNNFSFARVLKITTTFQPLNTTSLFIGIRENSFWLSYPKYEICCTTEQRDNNTSSISATVTIPITDKLIDTNGSLDLMFFSTNATSTDKEDEGISDKTMWILEDIQITSRPTTPTIPEIKDYILSRFKHKKPL